MRKELLLISLFVFIANDKLISQSWSALGSGLGIYNHDRVDALEIYNGELYVGGRFNIADTIPEMCIAKWNGTNWSAVGSGIVGEVYS